MFQSCGNVSHPFITGLFNRSSNKTSVSQFKDRGYVTQPLLTESVSHPVSCIESLRCDELRWKTMIRVKCIEYFFASLFERCSLTSIVTLFGLLFSHKDKNKDVRWTLEGMTNRWTAVAPHNHLTDNAAEKLYKDDHWANLFNWVMLVNWQRFETIDKVWDGCSVFLLSRVTFGYFTR